MTEQQLLEVKHKEDVKGEIWRTFWHKHHVSIIYTVLYHSQSITNKYKKI